MRTGSRSRQSNPTASSCLVVAVSRWANARENVAELVSKSSRIRGPVPILLSM